MPSEPSPNKYLKILLIILGVVVLGGATYFVWQYLQGKKETKITTSTTPSKKTSTPSSTGTKDVSDEGACTPEALTAEETAMLSDPVIENPTYHFSYKVLPEWDPAISNTDGYSSYAYWPWGDESLAGINLLVLVGDDVADFPATGLVEKSHRTVNIDCIEATYTVYEKTRNERWDKDEYHIRTTFTKGGQPYLIALNYPFQGASADGDVIDAYNATLKTIDFE